MRARHAGSQTGVSGTARNGVGFSCPWRTSCASVLSFLWLGFQLIWGEDRRYRVRRMVACVLSSSCSCVLTCARTSGWNSCGAWAGTRSLKGCGQFQLRTEEPPVWTPYTPALVSRRTCPGSLARPGGYETRGTETPEQFSPDQARQPTADLRVGAPRPGEAPGRTPRSS